MRILLALLLLLGCSKTPGTVKVACGDLTAGCRLAENIEVRFLQPASVLHAFDLEVTATGQELHASFQMQGMEMGLNRYRLAHEDGKWHAKVMLPACVEGRHDWLLRLEIDGTAYETPFAAN